MWANFFGRGLVNPVDDMVDLEQASHPELLKLLSTQFVASGYDLKYLVRCICNSQAYQRSSSIAPGNKEDDKLYSHMPVKVMSADMLYDSLQLVLGTLRFPPAARQSPEGKKKSGWAARATSSASSSMPRPTTTLAWWTTTPTAYPRCCA